MKNQTTKKTNYRLNLEKEFAKFNEEHNELLKLKLELSKETKEPALGVFILPETKQYEHLTFSSGEVVKARKDAKTLEKMSNKLIKAFDVDTKDGKKIQYSIPQRLQFLNEEPS